MRTNKLNYTIKFKDGGYETTVQVSTNDIRYAIKRACEMSQYCSDYIVEIHAVL